MVMSLVCPVGPEANGLVVGPEHCSRLVVENPILTLEEIQVCVCVCARAGVVLVTNVRVWYATAGSPRNTVACEISIIH